MKLLGKWTMALSVKRFLDLAWYLLLIGFALMTLTTVVAALSPKGTQAEVKLNVQFELDADQYRIAAPSWGVEKAKIQNAQGQLVFTNPGGFHPAALMGWANIMLLVALVAVYQLRQIFKTLAAGEPFHPDNAKRIQAIAGTIIVALGLRAMMSFFFTRQIQAAIQAEGLRLLKPSWDGDLGGDIAALLVVGMLMVIAQAFRIGAEMKKEQDLTV